MAVYLGSFGYVALTRKGNALGENLTVTVGSVNIAEKRFKPTYPSGDDVTNVLITGDRVTIKRDGAGDLTFIDGAGPTGAWYIHVDELGSLRLYDSLPEALEGLKANAVALLEPAEDIATVFTVKDNPRRILGQVASYELNTAKEAVDVTALSDSFRSQYSALVSGSGRLTAYWDFDRTNGNTTETPHYLLQLALRTEIGGEFAARLFLKPELAGGGPADEALYYAFDAVITNAGIQLAPDAVMQATIDFVTTGPIRLLLPTPTDEVLTEGGFKLLAEDDLTLDMELPID
jgi:hypothetical protein